MFQEWREHSKLKPRFHPDYPDDLQVLVHDGYPRLSGHQPELVWVRITGCKNNIFRGKVLNQPMQLTSVSKNSEILFIIPDSGEYPLLVTEKYLQERSQWFIQPCNKCGMSEIFGTPSELISGLFSSRPTDFRMEGFTAFCGVCGGVLVISHIDYNPEDEESSENQSKLTSDRSHQNKAWWQFWK